MVAVFGEVTNRKLHLSVQSSLESQYLYHYISVRIISFVDKTQIDAHFQNRIFFLVTGA